MPIYRYKIFNTNSRLYVDFEGYKEFFSIEEVAEALYLCLKFSSNSYEVHRFKIGEVTLTVV
jgi:hypothetical protein